MAAEAEVATAVDTGLLGAVVGASSHETEAIAADCGRHLLHAFEDSTQACFRGALRDGLAPEDAPAVHGSPLEVCQGSERLQGPGSERPPRGHLSLGS